MLILDAFIKILIITFEPIGVAMLIGMVLALFLYGKKRKKSFWVLVLTVLFLFIWRGSVELLSTRYCSIFIFAGVCFGGFACLYMPIILGLKFKQLRWMIKYKRLIARVLCIAIVISCIGKVLNYNRYNDTIIKCVDKVLLDAQNRPSPQILDCCKEEYRIGYYSKMPVISVEKTDNVDEQLSKLKATMENVESAYIFIEFETQERLTHDRLGLRPGELVHLLSLPNDNRKQKYCHVYFFKRGD